MTLRDVEDGGEYAVHAFHDVLHQELSRAAPKIGDLIGISYLGKHPDKDYHRYKLIAGGKDSAFDWATDGDPNAAAGLEPEVPADAEGLSPAEPKAGDDDDLPH